MEWPTIGLAVVIHASWLVLTAAYETVPVWLLFVLGGLVSGWHASFQHEATHGHPTPSRGFNFVLASNAEAVRLWRRVGFEIVGTIPDAFRHPTLQQLSERPLIGVITTLENISKRSFKSLPLINVTARVSFNPHPNLRMWRRRLWRRSLQGPMQRELRTIQMQREGLRKRLRSLHQQLRQQWEEGRKGEISTKKPLT